MVAVAFSLVLLTSLTSTDFLSDDALNMVQCALSCAQNENCGGYNWDENPTPLCKLIVWAGNGVQIENIAGKTYRRQLYQGKALIERPASWIDVGTIHDRCGEMGAVPILPPLTNLEKAIFQIRPKPFIVLGIKRPGPPSFLYTDHTGKEYDTSDSTVYKWLPNEPSNLINENFMFMNPNQEVGDAEPTFLFATGTCILCMKK